MILLLRNVALIAAVVLIGGGYAAHQYFLFQSGEGFAKWSDAIAGPNLAIGWLLFVAAVVFSFVYSKEDKDA